MFGIKVSQPEKNVNTATERELIVFSELENFKIHAFGTAQLTIQPRPGEETVVTQAIPHNLGYYPAFAVFVARPGSTVYEACPFDTNEPFEAGTWVDAYCTTTDLVLVLDDAQGAGPSGTYTFKYFIFAVKLL
jgi:hypothetical protein